MGYKMFYKKMFIYSKCETLQSLNCFNFNSAAEMCHLAKGTLEAEVLKGLQHPLAAQERSCKATLFKLVNFFLF